MTYRNFAGESGEKKRRCVAHATSDGTCELMWPTLAIGKIRIHVQVACDKSGTEKETNGVAPSKKTAILAKAPTDGGTA